MPPIISATRRITAGLTPTLRAAKGCSPAAARRRPKRVLRKTTHMARTTNGIIRTRIESEPYAPKAGPKRGRPNGALTAACVPKIDWTARAVPPSPNPVSPRPAMIWFAFSFSTTNQNRIDPMTQTTIAIKSANQIDCVSTMPMIVAQAPAIIRPSSPRCQMPVR